MYIFQQRLRQHGFTRGFQGEAQAYHHKLFLKGRPEQIARLRDDDKKDISPPTTATSAEEETEDQTVVTSSSASHHSKEESEESQTSEDDTSLSEEDDEDQSSTKSFEDEDDGEDQMETSTAPPFAQTTEQSMANDHLLQELLCDFAMDLDELSPKHLPSLPLPPATQEPTTNIAPVPAPKKQPLRMPQGPLRPFGSLRNGFGFGVPAVCIHSVPKGQKSVKGSVVKKILVDTTRRRQVEHWERKRYQRPLLQPISTQLNHCVWPSIQETMEALKNQSNNADKTTEPEAAATETEETIKPDLTSSNAEEPQKQED